MTTLVDLFRSLERRSGTFVVHDDGLRVRHYSYAEVTRAARGFAARLSREGLTQGDTLLIWAENSADWLACAWGAFVSGVVVVPVDHRATRAFAARIAATVDARVVLVGRETLGQEAWGSELEACGPASDASGAQPRVWVIDQLDWTADGSLPAITIAADDVAQVVFTSGATADPKGVVIRHRHLLANLNAVAGEIAQYRAWLRPAQPLRFLNLLPLSHLFGQSMATFIPPLVNGTAVFMTSLDPRDIVHRTRESRVSVIVCVPRMLEVLHEYAAQVDPAAAHPPAGLSVPRRWWRYRRLHRAFGLKCWAFVVGAAPLPPALEDTWKRLGFLVIQGYGLTETAPIVTLNDPFSTRTGSVGRPLQGVEVRIAEDGEVLVRGANVSEGYFSRKKWVGGREEEEREQGNGEAAGQGWLHTGDLGKVDGEGRLFIRGRKKEVIVTPDGLNVFPDDVEQVLEGVAGVVEAAVVGRRADDGLSERVHAVLVLQPGLSAETAVAAANGRLAAHQRIRGVSVWPEPTLPRTDGTGKLRRIAIRAWVEGAAAPSTPSGATLPKWLERITGGHPVNDRTPLDSLGLSSLDRVELALALEARSGRRLDEQQLAAAHTVADLRAMMTPDTTHRDRAAAETAPRFPRWNRHPIVRGLRRLSLATWILPALQLVARVKVLGLEHLDGLDGPVVLAANHQSHLDVPVIFAALPGHWRTRLAPAMAKEFFTPHFFPDGFGARAVATNRANYYLATTFFGGFPLPQREAGTRDALRYMGELLDAGDAVLIFPEGARSASGEIQPFRTGIGMIAARLRVPIVPIRLEGVHRILPPGQSRFHPGTCTVTIGPPLRLQGHDYPVLTREVEEAVRRLHAAAPA